MASMVRGDGGMVMGTLIRDFEENIFGRSDGLVKVPERKLKETLSESLMTKGNF